MCDVLQMTTKTRRALSGARIKKDAQELPSDTEMRNTAVAILADRDFKKAATAMVSSWRAGRNATAAARRAAKNMSEEERVLFFRVVIQTTKELKRRAEAKLKAIEH